jgi:hypothetical protein
MAGLVWRLTFGWLVAGALRLAWRYGPRLVVGVAALALWPSVAVAWGLRCGGLPAATARWPRRAPWYSPGLGLAGGLLAAAYVLSGASWRSLLVTLYAAGWLAPLAVPLGVPPLLAFQALAIGVPLWLAGGVVLAGLWPLYGGLVRGFVRRAAAGADGGRGSGHRTPDFAAPGAPIAVTLKPVPTQRIATAKDAAPDWIVDTVLGRGMLVMVVAPPGVGKTEIAYGMMAAAVDGLAWCGLKTRRPKRVLLLSEMAPVTLQPALLRWGFVAETTGLGAVQRLRLRYLRPADSPGHLIDVCYAHDLYAPAADGRIPQWADVVRAVVPVVKRGGYDVLIVDTLGSWMGNDASNVVMQEALGALRQVSSLGVAVLLPHHCAKSAEPPYQPRGGGAILGALDICWSLSRLSNDPKDARRLLDCSPPLKHRFSESAPPPLRLERVDADPDASRPRYGYRLLDGARPIATVGTPTNETPLGGSGGADALSDQQRRVLEALVRAPGHLATSPELSAATGLERNRVQEVCVALIKGRWVTPAGAGAAPARGGRPPLRYAVTPWGLEHAPGGDPDAAAGPAERLLHEALDPGPGEDAAPTPSEGAGGRAA